MSIGEPMCPHCGRHILQPAGCRCEEAQAQPSASSGRARHRLVAIGMTGTYRVYFDMTRDKAIRRYCEEQNGSYISDDRLTPEGVEKSETIREFEFSETFGAYDIWPDEKG